MSNLLEQITSQLGGDTVNQMANQLGAKPEQVQSAMGSILPMLMGAMAKNANSTQGAEALAGALDRDHDGGILENLGGFLTNAQSGPGAGILKHVLGEKRGTAEQVISSQSGLSQESTGSMMNMMAPILMGILGQQKKQQGLDIGGLVGMLTGAKQQVQQQAQQQNPQSMGLIGRFLDADGDGDIKDDLMRMGGNLLGNMFKK